MQIEPNSDVEGAYLEQTDSGARVNVAIPASQHMEVSLIQTALKDEFPTIRRAVCAALADWSNKHRRRARAALDSKLVCPRSVSRKHNNT